MSLLVPMLRSLSMQDLVSINEGLHNSITIPHQTSEAATIFFTIYYFILFFTFSHTLFNL